MTSYVPRKSVTLMATVYIKIFPAVDRELEYWQQRANEIPDRELREQALASINSKRFHCQGGAVYSLLAGRQWKNALRFIIAYQTISDYLDNLCDRSTSMDPDDFRLLHTSMHDALHPGNDKKNYYELRKEQEDGGYLSDLVRTCQDELSKVADYTPIEEELTRLCALYSDLQVHKHVRVEERVSRLREWFQASGGADGDLSWYEFSAAAGSTLGIFCLISYSLGSGLTKVRTENIIQAYFPYIQGLHILLDYYIDQQEDKEESDLNFCSFYSSEEFMQKRFVHFIEHARLRTNNMADHHFHEMVCHGLVGLYLGDPKVTSLVRGDEMRERLLRVSGMKARFFNWNTRLYYKIKGVQ